MLMLLIIDLRISFSRDSFIYFRTSFNRDRKKEKKGFSLKGSKTKQEPLLNTCNVYKKRRSALSIKIEKKKYKYIKMNLALILFVLGSIGFVFNRNNLILMIISIEITLLSVTVMILSFS